MKPWLMAGFIAWRNVSRQGRRSFTTLAAIALAMGLVIVVRGSLSGLRALVADIVISAQTGHLQVHQRGFTANIQKSPLSFLFTDDAALRARLNAVPAITAISPRLSFVGMASLNEASTVSAILGIEPQSERAVCPRRRQSLLAEQAMPTASVARAIGLTGASELVLLTNDREGVLNAVLVHAPAQPTNTPAFSGDDKLILMTLSQAQSLLRVDNKVLELALRVSGDVDTAAVALGQALGESFEVHTWRQLAPYAVDAMANQEAAFSAITGLFVMLLLLGVANTMSLLVLTRTQAIGTMMALGTTRAAIIQIVIAEAAILSVLGSCAGAVLGTFAIAVLRSVPPAITLPGTDQLEYLRPEWTFVFTAQACAACIVASMLAAALPARRAAKLRPSVALAQL